MKQLQVLFGISRRYEANFLKLLIFNNNNARQSDPLIYVEHGHICSLHICSELYNVVNYNF